MTQDLRNPSAIGPQMQLLVVTDGRPANLTQGLGLAEAMADHVPVQIPVRIACAELALRPGLDRLPSRLLAPLGRAAFTGLPAGVPDIVVGAGRRGNLAAHALGRQGARAVAVLDPHLPLARFAAVVVPAHDRLSGEASPGAKVLTTLGSLNRLSPTALAAAPQPFPKLPAPRLAVLIGGPSRSAIFDAEALIADLARFAGWSLCATASRRTPPDLPAALRAAFPGLWLWDGQGQNPYPGLLAAADAILVTADSVNMASEAAASGRPVFVSGQPSPGKHARFHAALQAHGASRPAAQAPADWSYTALHEAARVAPLVLTRLGFAQTAGAAYRGFDAEERAP